MNIKEKIIPVISHKIFYICLAVFYTLILALNYSPDKTTLIFSISSFLLMLHILFGGYFLFNKGRILDTWTSLSSIAVLISIYFLMENVRSPPMWFAILSILFTFAIIYHQRTKFLSRQEYIKEFCNYKTYIEVLGILGGLAGLILISIFQDHYFWISLLNLLGIIKLNHLIILRKKIYRISYPNYPKIKNPLVSIIIITYNEEKNIGNLLKSIKDQTYKKLEVIVVDDHSTDRTCEIARKFARSMRLRIVKKEIRGQSRSRNYGAEFAHGKILLFLDGDVILPEGFIENNIQEFSNKNLSVAFSDYKSNESGYFEKTVNIFYRRWLKTVQYYNPRAIGFCLWARKDIHNKTLFDPSVIMSEDFDYIKRASEKGKFRVLYSSPIISDSISRRFRKENPIKLVLKYLYFESYRSLIGEIRRPIAQYNYDRGDGKEILSIDNKKIN